MKTWNKTFQTSSWMEVYRQEEDTSSDRKTGDGEFFKDQEIYLEAVDALSNDHYLVIQTDRWALDVEDIDDFCQLLKDFMNRELKQKKK